MDMKTGGNYLYLIGKFMPVFGGSHYDLVVGLDSCEQVPEVLPSTPHLYRCLHRAISNKYVCSCHDLSEGGLAVAAAEMCIAGRLGLILELPDGDVQKALFGETNGCLLVEVEPVNAVAFEAELTGQFFQRLGRATSETSFRVTSQGKTLFDLPVNELVSAWNTSLQPA
jgi:phosphoribosylformylglycinamidine synthase